MLFDADGFLVLIIVATELPWHLGIQSALEILDPLNKSCNVEFYGNKMHQIVVNMIVS